MIKKQAIVIFAVLSSIVYSGSISAQNGGGSVKVELSEPHSSVKAPTKLYVTNDSYVVSMKLNVMNKITIQSFSKDVLSEIAQTEFEGIDSKSVVEKLCVINNKFYVFYSNFDKPNTIESLLALEIDPLTATAKGEPKKLVSVNHKLDSEYIFQGSYGAGSKAFGKYRMEFSRDEKKFMVYYRILPDERDESKSYAKIGIHVFSAALSEEWSTSDNMKYTEEEFIFIDYLLDAKGDVFILALGKVPTNSEYSTLELLKYSENDLGGELKTLPLEQISYIYSLSLEEKNADQILIGGLSFSMQSKTKAFFAIQIDKDNFRHDEFQHPIPQEILMSYNTKRENNDILKEIENCKEPKEGINLFLSKILVDANGNMLFLAEEGYAGKRDYEAPGIPSQGTYHIRNVVVAKINSEGGFDWASIIPKYQYGMKGLGGMSFSSIFDEDYLYVLYVDNENNLELSKTDKPAKHINDKGGFMTSAKIDLMTGDISKQHLFDMRSVNGVSVSNFSTENVIQLNQEVIAIEMAKKKGEDIWIKIGL